MTTPTTTTSRSPAAARRAGSPAENTRPSHPPVEQLVRQLYGLAAVRRGLSQAATKELATGGFSALVTIHRREPARVSDIAHALQIDLSVASRQVAALVEAGHAVRSADPADGRAQLLHVTDEGRSVLTEAHHRMIAVLTDALADWDDTRIATLAEGLQDLIHSFTDATAPTPNTDTDVSA